jgi:hypothetical protein
MWLIAIAAAYVFYMIAACALIGALVTQYIYFGKIGRIGLPMDFHRAPRQFKGFLLFAALTFIFFCALVTGRSIEMGRLPF